MPPPPPHSAFPSYPPGKQEKTCSYTKKQFSLKCTIGSRGGGEMNVILSLEMCFFMIINADGLDVKGFCKHSSLKTVFSALFMRHPSIHNSVQGLRFSVITCQGLFITVANNFPGQIILLLSSKWTSLPHHSCHVEIEGHKVETMT